MTILLDGMVLPDGLTWTDRYKWSPVTQNITKSLTGALIIQEAAQQKGRPITLAGSETSGWARKSQVDQLQAKVNTPATQMVLDFHGTLFNVLFNRDAAPLIAEPVVDYANPADDDYYSITLRFIEV